MSAINYAINAVLTSDIPQMILEDALISRHDRQMRRNISLEESINQKVIQQRVLPALNVTGVLEVDIRLDGLPFEKKFSYERIYRIPAEARMGREIIDTSFVMLSLTSNYHERQPGSSTRGFNVAPLQNAVLSMVAANSPVPLISNAEAEILADNVVMIRDHMNFNSALTLRCILSNDEEYSNLKPAYYQDFGELVIIATKAYVYRELALVIDQAKLDGGRELGRYKEFVEEYREAQQMFTDLINEKWYKIAILNDPQQKREHLRTAGKIKL